MKATLFNEVPSYCPRCSKPLNFTLTDYYSGLPQFCLHCQARVQCIDVCVEYGKPPTVNKGAVIGKAGDLARDLVTFGIPVELAERIDKAYWGVRDEKA